MEVRLRKTVMETKYLLSYLQSKIVKFLSWCGYVIIIFCVVALFIHYLTSYFQPVRWPTKSFFIASICLTIISRHCSVWMLVLILPLLPELHIQSEYILHPSVKYFVSFPAVDLIAGLAVGTCIRKVIIEKNFRVSAFHLPWPFGMALLIITMSVSLSVFRNLARQGEEFSWPSFFEALTRFKLLDRLEIYYPIADLITFGFAGLLIIILLDFFNKNKDKNELIFFPIIWGLLISALWGLFQSATSFGLTSKTSEYRLEVLGFGAQGFQPDLHAYAAHMMIGTIGCIGIFSALTNRRARILTLVTWIICWIVLLLSKSRASLLLSLGASIFLIPWLYNNIFPNKRTLSILATLLSLSLFLLFAYIFGALQWVGDSVAVIKIKDINNYDAMNELSRYRIDIQSAALKMGMKFPLFGLGQGLFYPLSGVGDFSQSEYLISRGGDNAHNYFLQTFTELGIIGIGAFLVIFSYPVLSLEKKKILIPSALLVLAVFLGNVYSHSLIIRENLYFLTIVMALIYSYQDNNKDINGSNNGSRYAFNRVSVIFYMIAASILAVFLVFATIFEIQSSFVSPPFFNPK